MKVLLLLLTVAALPLSAQLVGDTQTGLASYYSAEYNGATTAYDVVYDKDELVAAHKTYPFNSTVRVRNEKNGRTVTVRIIDKGPFIRGRIIELSERAATALGMLGEATVPVELELLSTPDQPGSNPTASRTERPRPAQRATTPPPPVTTPAAEERTAATTTRPPARIGATAPARPAPTVTERPSRSSRPVQAAPARYARTKQFSSGIYKIDLHDVPTGDYGVQVGSFSDLEHAMDKVVELQGRYFDNILLHRINTGGSTAVYKVILGPFDDQASAKNYASDLKSRYRINGFTVQLLPRP